MVQLAARRALNSKMTVRLLLPEPHCNRKRKGTSTSSSNGLCHVYLICQRRDSRVLASFDGPVSDCLRVAGRSAVATRRLHPSLGADGLVQQVSERSV